MFWGNIFSISSAFWAYRLAIILVSLIHEMHKRKLKKGLATLCIGGGMGIAMCVETDF